MRRLLILLSALALACSIFTGCGSDSTSPDGAGPPTFAKVFGSPPDYQTAVAGVTVLSDGTRLVAGTFEGFLHVTGEPDSLNAGGSERVFFARFAVDGSLVSWTQLAGGAFSAQGMARDPDDNLLLVGSYTGTTNFGLLGAHTSVGYDIMFAKVGRNGNTIWVEDASGSGDDFGRDIVSAGDGSFYMVGNASTAMMVAGENVGVLGHEAGFVVKVQADGAVGEWSATASTAGESSCSAVTASQDGSVVVCGEYRNNQLEFSGDTLSFDGGAIDGFIGRFGSNGTPMGAIHIGGVGNAGPFEMATLNNDAIVTGDISGDADFDGNGSAGNVTVADIDVFVARYSEAGQLRSVKTFGSGGDQIGRRLAILAGGHILVCGTFNNSITFGSTTLTSAGVADAFIARLDGDGNVLSASQLGGGDYDAPAAVVSSGSTAIILGITQSSEIVFPGGIHRNTFGVQDGYIYQQP